MPRRLLRLAAAALVAAAIFLAPWIWVLVLGRSQVTAREAPNWTIMVLGAAVYPDRQPSPFLAYRLDLAAELARLHPRARILLSGDGKAPEYDEPAAMAAYMRRQGIKESRLILDKNGLDTFASCRRAKTEYGIDELVVVTQTYHLARALTLCKAAGITAVGVGDEQGRKFSQSWNWGQLREIPAAWKALWEVVTSSGA